MRLNEQGRSLNIFDSPRAYGRNPEYALKNLVEKNPQTDWILFNSTQLMQQWFQLHGQTAVIAGSRFAGIHLPAVDIDSRATGVHAGHTLLGLGHSRIVFLRPIAATAGDLAVEAGLKEILGKADYTSVHFSVVTSGEGTTEICRTITKALAKSDCSTVVICARSTFVATVFSHLLQLGRRVPNDISLLSIEWEPFLDLVVPHISHYKVSPVEFAKQISNCISRSAAKQKNPIFLTQEYIKGGSLKALRPLN